LKVQSRTGETVGISVKPSVLVTALKAIQLSEIKPGSFVGTAATTGADGKLTASEVRASQKPHEARARDITHGIWVQTAR
jgi:hypothetical protein